MFSLLTSPHLTREASWKVQPMRHEKFSIAEGLSRRLDTLHG
jgi:hypothetical protein